MCQSVQLVVENRSETDTLDRIYVAAHLYPEQRRRVWYPIPVALS